nr:alpha/beta hydrolases superfamily protein [Tanacetum cinerariifolium]
MENSKRGSIPMQEKHKLSKSQDASTPAELKRMQNVPYASAMGSIMYAVRCTHPDEAVWVRKFISWLGVVPTIKEPISMYCDNTGAIVIANESGITKGARHFRAKVHYLREVIEYTDVKLEKVHTDDNLADPFTKALAFPKHFGHTRNIGMLPASSLMPAASQKQFTYGNCTNATFSYPVAKKLIAANYSSVLVQAQAPSDKGLAGWNDPILPEDGSLDYENPNIEQLLGVMECKVDMLMKNAISLMGRSEDFFGMMSDMMRQLPPKTSCQEAFEDLIMNFILDQEVKVKQFEEYMGVIGSDFMQLSSEVIVKSKEEIRMGENRVKKIEKIMRYPDTKYFKPLNGHNFSKALTKKASFHTPKFVSPKSLSVKYVHTIFPNPPLVRLYLMKRSLEVLRKFHWMILGRRSYQLSHRAKVTAIEESKDLSSLALDELIGNLKVHDVVIEKDSKIYRGKKERIKSIALKAKKEYSDDETSTSGSDDEEYAMDIRNFKKFFKRKDQKAFTRGSLGDRENDAEDKTNDETCLMAQSSNEIKRPSLEVLWAIEKMTPKTKPMTKLVSWLNRQMR